jgi:hypothetical protein
VTAWWWGALRAIAPPALAAAVVLGLSGTVEGTAAATGLVCGKTDTLGVDAFDAAGKRSSPTQLSASTAACPIAVGLVAAYGFNEGSGTAVADLSGNGNNGTVSGATWSSAGKYGGALSFNGTSSLVTVPGSASLDLTTGMTLEAWVDPAQLETAWRCVLFKERPADMVYALYASNGTHPNGQIYFGGAEHNVVGTSAVAVDAWTHLAVTFDGSTLELYVNSVLVSSVALSATILKSNDVLHIGGDSVWGEWFAGELDEIRIYNRALAASEIQTDMNTPVGGVNDTTPPTAPSNLTAAGSIGSAQLAWSASTDDVGVSSYNVHRGTVSGFIASAANQIATTTATGYTDGGLAAGTYYYRVTAQDAAGNVSAVSNEAPALATADTTPPSVSITAPAGDSSLSNTVTVTATASDDVGVAGVQFELDGTNLGSEVIAAPYSILWSTSAATNGPHTLTAVARDDSGNITTSAAVSVTVSNAAVVTPVPVPDVSVNGITVGDGFVDASEREVVRTANNVVYVAAADDDPCQGKTGQGVIHIWKGIGAQPGNASVPTSFAEQDPANNPLPAGSGDCTFSSVSGSPVLSSPDIRLDRNGIIHLVYIDESIGSGVVYYQTYSTVTDTWGGRTAIANNGMQYNGLGWPRFGMVALTLDANDVPRVVYCTSGTSNQVVYTDQTSGSWSTPVAVSSGTDEMHVSLVTALDGTLHLAWLDNALATHAVIRYAHYALGAWSAVETVSAGDSLVLANGDNDQGPSIATDLGSLPYVSYLDGTVNGSDNDVRMRYRTATGVWNDDTPPGAAGGPSSPDGTWYTHAPQNYISSAGANFVFLGHDVNISPGGYEYQMGGPANNWSAYATIEPRNLTSTTAGAPGIDGSASVRFDPLRDNNASIVDLLYFDENDGTGGYAHHATVYYKALIIG